MKKVVILSAMALLGGSFVFTSCSKKKDWTCTCTMAGVQSVSYPIVDQKEDNAKKLCTDYSINGLSCTLSEN